MYQLSKAILGKYFYILQLLDSDGTSASERKKRLEKEVWGERERSRKGLVSEGGKYFPSQDHMKSLDMILAPGLIG